MKCIVLILGLLILVGVAWGQGDPCEFSQTVDGPSIIVMGTWTENASGILPGGCELGGPISCNGNASGDGCPGLSVGSFTFTYNDPTTTATFSQGFTGGDSTCASYDYVFADTAGTEIGIGFAGVGGLGCIIPSLVPPGIGSSSNSNPQATASEPISTGSGNYYYQHTDLSISGSSLPLNFERTYNSQDSYSGALGNNWTHTYNITVAGGSTGAVVKWGDGHGENYTLINAAYIPGSGVSSTLTQDLMAGTWTLTRKDGMVFTFYLAGKLWSITDRNGNSATLLYDAAWNLTDLQALNQNRFDFSYDSDGRMVGVSDNSGRTEVYSYDSNSNLISATDPLGNVTTYAYDASGRVLSATLPDGSRLFQNTYDASGRVISQTNADGFTTTLAYNVPAQGQTTITDPFGNKTVHTYDASLRLIGITDALGHTTTNSYDANNDVVAVTDARGNTTSYTYDSLGNVLSYADPLGNTASFTYNSFSEPLTITTPKGDSTSLTYDANGNLITVQDPLGKMTALAYNYNGELLTVTDARNNMTSLSYGLANSGCEFCVTGITDALGNMTSLAYDAIGRLTSVTDPNGHATSVAYDALSHIVSVTNPLSDQTLFTYDTVSNLTAMADANGHATSYGYDAVGNLTQVTDALGHKTSYSYDKNNNRTAFTNAKQKVTKYSYDHANRLVKITDPLSFSTSYALDPVGNVDSLTDANGKKNSFNYDADNRLYYASYSDGSVVKYSFDADGNRKAMVDPDGTTTYAYDALDRVTSIDFPASTSVHYAYDPVGNRSSLTYPDHRAFQFAYDADNRLSEVTDWVKRSATYSYDPASNLTGIAFPNAVNSALVYDAASRLTRITSSANSAAYRVLAYTLDKVGNRTSVKDNGVATSYAYNALNELVSSTTASAKTSWTYDAAGNRFTQTAPTGVVTDYTYDSDDRMLTAGSTTFTYDNNGNRLTEVAPTGTTTYAYDANNRLLSVAAPTETSTFTYDGDGNRTTQTVPSGTYSYVNDTATALPVVLNENGPDGAIDYGYGLGLLESFSSGFNYFYNLDGLGSVSDLTNAKGVVVAAYSYDAWGAALTTTGSVGTKNKFGFTGQALDPGTGLYFLRARYYHPALGRLLTKDPLAGNPQYPTTLNHYIYATNSPTNAIDPTGMCAAPNGSWDVAPVPWWIATARYVLTHLPPYPGSVPLDRSEWYEDGEPGYLIGVTLGQALGLPVGGELPNGGAAAGPGSSASASPSPGPQGGAVCSIPGPGSIDGLHIGGEGAPPSK